MLLLMPQCVNELSVPLLTGQSDDPQVKRVENRCEFVGGGFMWGVFFGGGGDPEAFSSSLSSQVGSPVAWAYDHNFLCVL